MTKKKMPAIGEIINIAEYRKIQQGTQLENDFQNDVIDAAKKGGWLAYHVYDVRTATERGFPDLVLVRDGEIIFAELKKQDGVLSSEQKEWLRVLQTVDGIEVAVWRPCDYDSVIERLSRRKAV